MEKEVRKDFEIDFEEQYELLFKLFKKRHKQLTQQASSEEGASSQVNNDPFGDQDFVFQKNLLDNSLLDASERPDGIDDHSWERLNDLRFSKIEKENEITRRSSVLNEMKKFQDQLSKKDAVLENKFQEILRELRDFKERRIIEAANLEVLFKLKQGQVEVEQSAVVTDYSKSVLINRAEIENLNKDIRALGTEKVSLLKDIKNMKKLIRKKKWDNKKLDMIAEDLAEKTKYFQLLRVTKQLQELIKGGEEDLHAAELKNLENTAEHSAKVT
jgi:hypothetical protein